MNVSGNIVGGIREGYEAHKAHKRRTDNPYLASAIAWDQGWVNRQKEELTKSGKGEQAEKIRPFKRWLRER